MSEEYFDVVDKNNILTGETVLRRIAHAEGVWHRVVHIYFFRKNANDIEFLVHLRSKFKDLNPNKWDTRFGGHVNAGQSISETIKKEILEEAGIEIDSKYLIESSVHPYDGISNREHVYVNYYNFTGDLSELSFNDGEVQEVRWMSCTEIEQSMQKNPEIWSAQLSGFRRMNEDLAQRI